MCCQCRFYAAVKTCQQLNEKFNCALTDWSVKSTVTMHSVRWPTLSFGVNFTNILSAVFILADPKSVKNTVKSSVYFGLSGSARVKAARKNLMKLTLGWLEKSEPCFLVTLRHVIPCRFCQHQLQRTSYVKRLTKIDLDGERKRDKTEKQRNVK